MQRTTSHFTAIATAAAAAATLALTPTAAHADSLVYTNVAEADIWVAEADGSGGRAVTTDGTREAPWRTPSQADDGTILADHNGVLTRLDRQGRVLNTIQTVQGGGAVKGPFDARLSPDGTKVAYDVYVQVGYQDPHGIYLSQGFWLVFEDARTGDVLGYASNNRTPSWLADSGTVLGFDPDAYLSGHVNVAHVGAESNAWEGWLRDSGHPMGAGELTRDERWAAFLQAPAGNESPYYANNFIGIFGVTGHTGEPASPEGCQIHPLDPGQYVRDPSWSPDGRSLTWWQSDKGQFTSPFDGTCGSIKPTLVVAGGAQADWGPAPRGEAGPAAGGGAPTGGVAMQPPGTKGQGGGPGGRSTTAPDGTSLTAPGRVKATALAHGVEVRLHCAPGCEARPRVVDGRRTVARRSLTTRSGDRKVRMRLPARTLRRLGRSGHRSLTVHLTVGETRLTRTITVHR